MNVHGDDGQPAYKPNGEILKEKIQMVDATFEDGTRQSLYFEGSTRKQGYLREWLFFWKSEV